MSPRKRKSVVQYDEQEERCQMRRLLFDLLILLIPLFGILFTLIALASTALAMMCGGWWTCPALR